MKVITKRYRVKSRKYKCDCSGCGIKFKCDSSDVDYSRTFDGYPFAKCPECGREVLAIDFDILKFIINSMLFGICIGIPLIGFLALCFAKNQ